MVSGYLFYDGYNYKLVSSVSGRKGDKGDKGDQGIQGETGSYQDGYSSLAIEKAFSDNFNQKLLNPQSQSQTITIVSDILTQYSISGSIINMDSSEDSIYFITDSPSTTPIYGIDNFSYGLNFNPVLSETVSWKEIKYARLNGIEVIALSSDNGFAYFDKTNSIYYSTTTNSVTTNCSKLHVDSGEVSFFTSGKIYKLTSDGSTLSLNNVSVQPVRNSYAFHKVGNCYYNSDSANPNNIYKTDFTTLQVSELDVEFVVETKTIISDSEYVYFIAPLEDIKKINNKFELVDSIDLSGMIGLGTIDPYNAYYDGSRLVLPNPDSNKIFLYYPSTQRYDIINPSTGMDIVCRQSFYDKISFLLSGGTDIVSYSYLKRNFVNSIYNNGGNYKKPTYVDNTLSPYTVQSTDSVIVCYTSTGAITIDLPSDISLFGSELVIVDVDGNASSNNISITGVNANSGAGKTISTNYARAVAYCYLIDSGPDAYWVVS